VNMTQKVLTKIFESLLNTAAQAPTDDIVNRDGISLMKQGFELIMQGHREGGATGPTSPLLADARQLLADIEGFKPFRSIEESPKERVNDLIGVGMPQKPVTLATLSERLVRIEALLVPVHEVVCQEVKLDISPECEARLAELIAEANKTPGRLIHR
jgi:hypothetical protein